MPGYMISLNLKDRKCIVVGGGPVADRKVRSLLESEADVVVVAPEIVPELMELINDGKIRHIQQTFEAEYLDEAFLVIAATDDAEINKSVYTEAKRRGILVNVVDQPDLCTFFVPAVVRRGELTIGISTSGRSPSLARKIKREIDPLFGPEYGEFAELLGKLRAEVHAKYPCSADRCKAFARILDSDVLELLEQGERDKAERKARQCI
ncbi:MAG: precorrin-2 dehydrogenase/sirohydrochlorin ferrochelatase family protein [Armatimonadota bacterium]